MDLLFILLNLSWPGNAACYVRGGGLLLADCWNGARRRGYDGDLEDQHSTLHFERRVGPKNASGKRLGNRRRPWLINDDGSCSPGRDRRISRCCPCAMGLWVVSDSGDTEYCGRFHVTSMSCICNASAG